MDLYETIARSKIVINAFTKFNGHYKDNMRNYESIGCGALLIGEDGVYPEHFVPNTDFYTYRSPDELIEKIENVLSMPDQGLEMAIKTREKLKQIYSKENQWISFVNTINSF
jgi:spore maturation protein CgeB